MVEQFKEKVAVVTGGSSGIGFATARKLSAGGATVFITGRRLSELSRAADEIGGNVVPVQADSSRLADLEALYQKVRDTAGRIDILFANAGILEKAALGSITEAMVDRLLSVNIKEPYSPSRTPCRC